MKAIAYIAKLSLVLLLVVCSLGLTINSMTCMSSGRLSLSLDAFTDCCGLAHDDTSIDQACCSYDSQQIATDNYKLEEDNKKVDAVSLITKIFTFFIDEVASDELSFIQHTADPPRLHTPAYLQVFLI